MLEAVDVDEYSTMEFAGSEVVHEITADVLLAPSITTLVIPGIAVSGDEGGLAV